MPRPVLVVLGVVALAVLPLFMSASYVNAAIQMLIAALFATAFNLLCGQAGMLSFGHAAFFGVGAFATVHAMNALGGNGLVPTPLLPAVGGIVGLLVGAAAGWFATQRTGTYFAMITLALAELLHALAPHLKGVFGGESGISTMRMPSLGLTFGSGTEVYYLTLAWVLGCVGLLYLYTLTPVGRLTLGLRENSHRLKFLGYNVHLLSVLVFSISAMFSGVAGGLQVVANESVNYVVLDVHLSASVLLNSFIGGVKVFLGPALGASLMTFFGYVVSDLTNSWLLYQGVLFVVVMMFMPTGLAGVFKWWYASSGTYGAAKVFPVLALWAIAVLLLASGAVFVVELLQRIFSLDYRALAAAKPITEWPAIALLGRQWLPGSLITWLPPVALLAAGSLTARVARSRWHALVDEDVSRAQVAGELVPVNEVSEA